MKKAKYKITYYSWNDTNQKIINFLQSVLTEWELDEENPDYVFVLGGDGTFLHFFNIYKDKNVKLIGINSGTLGFYTIGNLQELSKEKNLSSFFKEEKNYFKPLLLSSKMYENDKFKHEIFSLNDLVIQSVSTMKSDIFLNNELYFNNVGSSGIIFCTPTGSTGTNKSNGGPIFFSSLNSFCVSLIMPLNSLKYSSFTNPFIFSKNEIITWLLKNQEIDFQIASDGIVINTKNINKIEVSLVNSESKIFMPFEITLAIKHFKNFF